MNLEPDHLYETTISGKMVRY